MNVVDMLPERVAYLIEGTGNSRRLFLYRLVEEARTSEDHFDPVGKEVHIGVVITDISGIFLA